MKFTIEQKRNGEMAVRNLSDEAQNFYSESDPLDIYELENGEGEKTYSIRGFFEEDNLTLQELDELLSSLYKEFGELE